MPSARMISMPSMYSASSARMRSCAAGPPWVFYTGMCAGFFLPMALYGAGNAGIVNLTPPRMRSTLASFNMLCINVFALSIGNVVAGRAVDVMAAHGVALPLTHVVLASDILGIASVVFFALAAVAVVRRRGSASPVPVGAYRPGGCTWLRT